MDQWVYRVVPPIPLWAILFETPLGVLDPCPQGNWGAVGGLLSPPTSEDIPIGIWSTNIRDFTYLYKQCLSHQSGLWFTHPQGEHTHQILYRVTSNESHSWKKNSGGCVGGTYLIQTAKQHRSPCSSISVPHRNLSLRGFCQSPKVRLRRDKGNVRKNN